MRTFASSEVRTEDVLAAKGDRKTEGSLGVGKHHDGYARMCLANLNLLDGGQWTEHGVNVSWRDGRGQRTHADDATGLFGEGRGLEGATLLRRRNGAGLGAVGETNRDAPEEALQSVGDVLFGVHGNLGCGVVDDCVGLESDQQAEFSFELFSQVKRGRKRTQHAYTLGDEANGFHGAVCAKGGIKIGKRGLSGKVAHPKGAVRRRVGAGAGDVYGGGGAQVGLVVSRVVRGGRGVVRKCVAVSQSMVA